MGSGRWWHSCLFSLDVRWGLMAAKPWALPIAPKLCWFLGAASLRSSGEKFTKEREKERKPKHPRSFLTMKFGKPTKFFYVLDYLTAPFKRSTSLIGRKIVKFCCGRDKVILKWHFFLHEKGKVIFASAIFLMKICSVLLNGKLPWTSVWLGICGHVSHDVTVSQIPSWEIRIAAIALTCKDEFSWSFCLQ